MVNEKRLYEALGVRLKGLREALPGKRGRLTQGELAEQVGLERTSITNIESGNQKVPLHVLYRICDRLGVAVAEVLPPMKDVREVQDEVLVRFGSRDQAVTPLVHKALVGVFSDEFKNGA